MRHSFALTVLVTITAACGGSGGDTATSDANQPAVTASAEAPASDDSSDQPDANDSAATTLAPTADAPATTNATSQQTPTTAAQQVESNETRSDAQETVTTAVATTASTPTTPATTTTTLAETSTTAATTSTTSTTTSSSTSTTSTTAADPGIVVSELTCRWGSSSINVTVKAEHRPYIPEGERGIDSVELIKYNEYGNPSATELNFGVYTLEWSGSANYSSQFRDKEFADVRIISHDGETTETIRLRRDEDPC